MKKRKIDFFPKSLTGISGLDEITNGGLPTGRPTLICGSAGCGKTLFAMQFLVNGITTYNEPGVFMSFEEPGKDLSQNMLSIGFDLEQLKADKLLRVDYVHVERTEIEENGEFDLEGLFIRLNYAIDSIGAKRVVLDTIESLFSSIDNQALLRSEIRRLFQWLKEKGVTAIITGERGEATLTRQGLEEYVSDCVILLDFRVIDQIATRRLRIIKYRGSTHGTNEYPFLIDTTGISVLPITSLTLNDKSSTELISTGLPAIDNLFSGGGIFRGGITLVTGSAGTSKTILASYFAMSSCRRNEPVIYFSFEESPDQLIRNMATININFKPQIKSKLLHIHSSWPSLQGLEMHLLLVHKMLVEIKPRTVIIDPISSLVTIGNSSEIRAMLIRLIYLLKVNQINAFFTSLTQHGNQATDPTIDAVSSLADTWINVSNQDQNGEGIRTLNIIKSRGTGHSNTKQAFIINSKGMQLGKDVLKKN